MAYQKPSNPAPVSGPGAHSQRTDGQPGVDLPNAKYGENAQYRQDEAGAPMAGPSSSAGSAALGGGGAGGNPLTPLDAPSEQPDTPVTDGAALGPGAGPEGWGAQANAASVAIATKYLSYLMKRAADPDVSKDFRALVSYLQGIASPGANPSA